MSCQSRSKSDAPTSTMQPYNDQWSKPLNNTICLMPSRRLAYDKPCCVGSSIGQEQLYNSRVLLGNWFEERRMYHQLHSRCTGHSIYRTDYLPHEAGDYNQGDCLPPKKYETKKFFEGQGWNLLRNSQDYCDYLSNYTTTYDLMHNWELRRAGCKPKPKRKWRIVRGLWLPETDNALSFGNLTQYGFRQSPALPPVPNDWKTYSTDTEYSQRYQSHKYPEFYTLCRYAPPKCVSRELSEYGLVNKPRTCWCGGCRWDGDGNNVCCPCNFRQNPKRFSNKCFVSNLLPSKPIQTLYHSNKDPYSKLKHPPHTLAFDSRALFNSPHSCDNQQDCQIGQVALDLVNSQSC